MSEARRRGRRAWLAVAAAAFSGSVAGQAGPDAARQALRDGERLWSQKRTRSAVEALLRAATQPEVAAEARYRLGRIYFFKGWQAEGAFPGWHDEPEYREQALAEFERALEQAPSFPEARRWRSRALHALGRDAGPDAPASVPADAAASDEIQRLRAEKRHAELIEAARGFVDSFPDSERLPAVYDALIEAYATTPGVSEQAARLAIDTRIAAQPDPGAYLAGANLLLRLGAYDRARQLAEQAAPAAQAFVSENLGSYKLADKARGVVERARASSADLAGWVLFQQGDLAAAEARLIEAERLSRGQDFANQFHLAELLRRKRAPAEARDRYLNALALAGGAEAQRLAVRRALAELRAEAGHDPAEAEAEAWLAGELQRRREERRAEALRSMVDRPLPALRLVSLAGAPVDLTKLRGRVLLFTFFASW